MNRRTPIILACSAAVSAACRDTAPPASPGDSPGTRARVTAVATSVPATPLQIAPYDDSLFICEYTVDEIVAGTLPSGQIRVAHWAVLASEPVAPELAPGTSAVLELVPFDSVAGLDQIHLADDLDPASPLPLYLDVSGTLGAMPDTVPNTVRFDYRGGYSPRFEAYWQLRAQLRLVVVGNSHAGVGILPSYFYPAESARTPLALNLSMPAAGFFQEKLVVDEYLLDLPDLRWVVWELSPRIFNRHFVDGWRFDQFRASTGYRFDRSHRDALWPIATAAHADRVRTETIEGISDRIDAWGGTKKVGVDPDFIPGAPLDQALAAAAEELEFVMNEEVWTALEATVDQLSKRGVATFLCIAPMHPALAQSPAADNDQTGDGDYDTIVRRLTALASRVPKVAFRDFNNGGHHEFGAELFWDLDHLNADGARAFSPALVKAMAEIDPTIAAPAP